MRFFVIVLFLTSFFLTDSFAQNSEDCVDAHIIAPVPTLLQDIPDITIDSLIGAGTEPAEFFQYTPLDCGPDGYTARNIDKSYWFAFSAVTDGKLELMITPEDLNTDYDFAIFKGFCPNDPCSEPILCVWQTLFCAEYQPTGIAEDPLVTFGEDPTLNLQIIQQALELEAGQNYYLLVENRNESDFPECPRDDSLGFTIEFDGTATIGPLLDRPTIDPLEPVDTSQILSLCEGDTRIFAVTKVPNAANYDWVSKSTLADAAITRLADGDSVSVQFGTSSGQLCMEIVCPVQSIICWDIEIDQTPDLEIIPQPNAACSQVDLVNRFRDNNNIANATIAYYESEADALNDLNPLSSSIVTNSGSYWVKKTSANGCANIVEIDVLIENVSILPIQSPVQICDATFFDLADININNAPGNTNNLTFFFYEDSTTAANKGLPLTPTVVFTSDTYWIRAENQMGGNCYDLQSFDLVFDAAPDIAAIPLQQLCEGECIDFSTFPIIEQTGRSLAGFDTLFFASEVDARTGDMATALSNICISGTYWLRLQSSAASCSVIQSFDVEILPAPVVDDVTLNLDCNLGCLDLNAQIFIENNGLAAIDLNYQFFDTEAAANDLMATPLNNLDICNPTELWLRVAYMPNGCFDVAKVTVSGATLATATLAGNQTICAQDQARLTIECTGTAPFRVLLTDGTNNFDTTFNSNNIEYIVSPNATSTYSLVSVEDGNACMGSVNGIATVTVNTAPMVVNLSQDCNLTATEFTLSFDIQGGDVNSYTIAGINGSLNGTSFISAPIPSGTNYNFQINDANNCMPVVISGVFSCECNSQVGNMDVQAINVCEREAAIGFYLGGETLEKGDTLLYILHDNSGTTLGNITASNAVPIFTFDNNIMEYGQTYYMSAIITKTDITGNPILSEANNPCLRTSAGSPVIFYSIPDASLSLSATQICSGDPIDLTFHIDGEGLFDVNYFDGDKISTLTAIDSGYVVTARPNISTNFYIQSVRSNAVQTCTRDLMTGQEIDITVFNAPAFENLMTLCNDEGTRAVLRFDITGGDANSYVVNGLTGTLTGNQFVSDSIAHGTAYQIEISDNNNCTPVPVQGIVECLCTADIAVNIEVVQAVSCRGEQDAILQARPVNGAMPYTYFWNDGSTNARATNMASGMNSVTMTDANGCQVMSAVDIEEPSDITASFNTIPITCYGARDGGILIVGVQGGTSDYTYSFNGAAFQADNLRDNFTSGAYEVAVKDANGCILRNEVVLEDPPQLDVSLGGDRILNLGDSLTLTALVNQNIMGATWESTDLKVCSDCIKQSVQPTKSSTYKVEVVNSAGCIATDEIRVQVQNNHRIFIPTAFSPNGDGANDVLHPYTSIEVDEISMFRIYNRWGELIFERKDMSNESGSDGWNGMMNTGKKAPPGVYVYYAEVLFKDGVTDIVTGDVSLIR